MKETLLSETTVTSFGDISSFTGYEPNTLSGSSSFTGYESKNVPISLEPAATQRGSPSSIVAGGDRIAEHQGNPAATLPIQAGSASSPAAKLPIQAGSASNPAAALPIQAGSASDLAQATLVQADPPDTLSSDLGSMMETSMSSVEDFLSEPIVPVTNVPSNAWGSPMPNEVQQLKQELCSLRSELHETKIIAENYAEHVKTMKPSESRGSLTLSERYV